MEEQLQEIVDGWKNLIIPNPTTEELGKQRMSICLRCDIYSKLSKRCKACGCFMPAGVRSLQKKCPLGKW